LLNEKERTKNLLQDAGKYTSCRMTLQRLQKNAAAIRRQWEEDEATCFSVRCASAPADLAAAAARHRARCSPKVLSQNVARARAQPVPAAPGPAPLPPPLLSLIV
jgi:hypothetical protein